MGIEALEGRQQGRVDVEYAPLPFPDEIGGEQAHETGQADEIDAVSFECRLHCAFEPGAILAESRVVDDLGGNAGSARNQKAAGIRPVGNDQHDFSGITFVFRSLDERSHIGAAAGDEHGDALATHSSPEIEFAVINDACVAGRLAYVAKGHDGLAGARKRFGNSVCFLG